MFEARYLMKWLLLHFFVFSFSMCYLDISFFLFLIKYYITFTISFRNEKNRSHVKDKFHFLSVNELSSSETRLISTSSGIVMALAIKTKMGNK